MKCSHLAHTVYMFMFDEIVESAWTFFNMNTFSRLPWERNNKVCI